MIEAEMTFSNLRDIINISERLIKFLIKGIIKNSAEDIQYLEDFNNKEIIKNLKDFLKKKFVKITYTKCIKILREKSRNDHKYFTFNKIS